MLSKEIHMPKRRKRKKTQDNNTLLIVLIVLLLLIALCSIIAYYTDNGGLTHSIKQDGYTTEDDEDAFYKQIVTNNTLDDYYDSLSKKQDNSYEEYYLLKESLNFMEMKLVYQQGVATSLNFTSDLHTLDTTFNFELSYENAYLLMEGNSSNDFECEVVSQKSISNDTKTDYCNYIQQELSIFLQRRSKVLENTKVQELLANPRKEYITNDHLTEE